MYKFLLLLVVLAGAQSVYAASGTIDPIDKYAWSENFGWINFAPAMGNVVVSDTELSGYAWSETGGWITLHPSSTTYVHNTPDGKLSGYAWGESTGYINFDGVTIDEEGYFHGYARSDVTGRISFTCENTASCGTGEFRVRTSWLAQASVPDLPQVSKSSVFHLLRKGVGVIQTTIAAWIPPTRTPVVYTESTPKEKLTASVPAVIHIMAPSFPWILFGVLLFIVFLCLAWILMQYLKRRHRRSIPYSYRHKGSSKRKKPW